MKQFVRIFFSVSVLMIALVVNSSGQCATESNSSVNFNHLIFSGDKSDDCGKSKFDGGFRNIFGLSKTELPFANSSGSNGGVTVNGKPDLTIVSDNRYGDDGAFFEGIYRVSLQITCTGAASPRIGWGATHLYYAEPFELKGQKIEFPGFIGLGEQDGKNSVMMQSSDHTEGGARIFPMTEQVSCIDLDHREQSMTLKDVIGATRLIAPSMRLVGEITYANPSDHPEIKADDPRFAKDEDEEFDNLHIPVGKLVTICMALNIHPVGDESFQLIQASSSFNKIIHSYKEKDPHTFNPCETMTFDKAGSHELYLLWQPYGIKSNKFLLKAVNK